MKIFKYEVKINGFSTIEMPKTAFVLCVKVQRNIPYIWVLCNPSLPLEERLFTVRTTGQSFDVGADKYIGTFLLDEGSFAGHLFEVR